MTITTGLATREGTAEDNADAARVYTLEDGTVGAAVIDGIGHGPHTSRTAPLLAETAARIAARRGPLGGLLAASELIADRGADGEEADAVAVAVRVRPDDDITVINWTGDARAYGWDGERLELYTDDHTVGRQLRANGVSLEIAREHDNWLRTSLSRATIGTVYTASTRDQVVILTSDGVHDQMPADALEDLVREHQGNPQALADALVAAAQPDQDGYRDDATAVVIAAADLPTVTKKEEPMSERVNVKVLLLVGGEAEVVADASDADAPARYAASLIAEEVGVPASELPGMRLSAVVGADDRLSGWQRR
ncbi:hypothetical protein ACIOWM_07050 [Streptomyces anulatus]